MTGATAPRLQLELIAARLLLPGAAGESGYAARLDRLERRLDVGGAPSGSAPSAPSLPSAQPAHQVRQAPTAVPAQAAPATPPPAAPQELPQPVAAGAGRTLDEPPDLDEPPEPEDHEPQLDEPRARPTQQAAATQPAAQTQEAAPSQQQAAPAQQQAAPAQQPAAAVVPPAPAAAPPAPARPGGLDTAAIRRSWPDVLAKVFELRRTTWTFVSEHAQVLDYDGERLLLGISTTGLANTFRRGPHATYVQQALIDVLGIDARVEGVPADGSSLGGSGALQTIDPNLPPPAPVAEPSTAQPASRQAARPQDAAPRGGDQDRGDGPAADAPGQRAAPQPDWGTGDRGGPAAPDWATAQAPSGGPDEPSSPFARAKVAVAAEPDPDETPVADDSAISEDDEDIEGLGEIGVPVVERVLGGKVIHEEGA